MKKVLIGVLLLGIIITPCYAEESTDDAITRGESLETLIKLPVETEQEGGNYTETESEFFNEEITSQGLGEMMEAGLGMSVEEYEEMLTEVDEELENLNPEEIVMKNDVVSFYANNLQTTPGIGATLDYELVNNTDYPIIFYTDGFSINGLCIDAYFEIEVDAHSFDKDCLELAESFYKPFGIKTEDVKDLEFFAIIRSTAGSNGETLLSEYVQSHKNIDDWFVSCDVEMPGTTIFDTPEITIKANGLVEGNAVSQMLTYTNKTLDTLRLEVPLVKINGEISEMPTYATIPGNKSGYKNLAWSQTPIDGVNSVVVKIRVFDVNQKDENGQETLLLDKNVEIVIK